MSGQIPGIKEAGTTRSCSFIISLTHSFRMATKAFIRDVEDSEGSVGSLQLKQRVCSYTLVRVLVGVLAVLVLAMTGGIIWMKLSQNCPERVWNVIVAEKRIIFTAPRTDEYKFRGKVCTKETSSGLCHNSFRLLLNGTEQDILKYDVSQEFNQNVNLEKGSGLKIEMNCEDMEIDEETSSLNIYQKNC